MHTSMRRQARRPRRRHTGDTPYYIPSSDDEEERGVRDMELTDAVTRLDTARDSICLDGDGEDTQPDSFNSTEDSFAEENSRKY